MAVQPAADDEAADEDEDEDGDGGGDVRLELRSGNRACGAERSGSDAAEKSPLFGCAAD